MTEAPAPALPAPASAAAPRRSKSTAITIPDNPTPGQLLAIALHRGDALDKLERLMAMKERWEEREASKAFDAAISAAKAEIKPILKNRRVDFPNKSVPGRTQYNYEDYAAVAEHIDPILARHGLSVRHKPKQEGGRLYITCILSHRDGHKEETTLDAPYDTSGNKSPAQGIASTGTLLQRYTVKLALGLSAAEDDDNGQTGRAGEEQAEQDTGPRISPEQVKELEGMLAGMNLSGFLKWACVDRLQDLPARAFDTVKLEIKARKGKGGTEAPQRKSQQGNAKPATINATEAQQLRRDLDREGIRESDVLRKYDLGSLEEMTTMQLSLAQEWIEGIRP